MTLKKSFSQNSVLASTFLDAPCRLFSPLCCCSTRNYYHYHYLVLLENLLLPFLLTQIWILQNQWSSSKNEQNWNLFAILHLQQLLWPRNWRYKEKVWTKTTEQIRKSNWRSGRQRLKYISSLKSHVTIVSPHVVPRQCRRDLPNQLFPNCFLWCNLYFCHILTFS